MKRKNIVLISIGVILVIAIVIRVVYINNKYPSPKNNVYTMDQELNYKDCIIKVLSYQAGSPEICKDVLDEYDYDHKFGESSAMANVGKKVVLVTVDVKNNSEDTFRPTSLQITSGNLHNGINMNLVTVFNKNGFSVKSDSESQVILAYVFTENNVTSTKWNNFENEEFALSCGDRNNHNLLMLNK